MNPKVKRYGIPATLLVGGLALGSMFSPIGFAVADDQADGSAGDKAANSAGHGHGHGKGHGKGRGFRGFAGQEVAEFLGLSSDEVRSALRDGQTLAELAEAQGVAESDLVDFLVTQIQERVEEAVEEGKIDADMAADKLADVEEHVTEMVNGELGKGHGHGHGKGHGKGRGFRGFADKEKVDA